MKKVFLILISFLFVFCSQVSFAQTAKKVYVDKIGSWREDMSCGLELNRLIRTYGDSAVPKLEVCCKQHSSACLDTYSGPDNKTLLYTAIEVKAYEVVHFLFRLSQNYLHSVDAFGQTITTLEENDYLIFTSTQENTSSLTPLMLACLNADLKGVQILIDYGANLLKRNYTPEGKPHKNAYEYAMSSRYKYPEFIKYVQRKYEVQKSMYGQVPNLLPEKENFNSKESFFNRTLRPYEKGLNYPTDNIANTANIKKII